MIFILISALSSVCVALLLKQARNNGMDTLQLIGWNYCSAVVLSGLILQPQFSMQSLIELPWLWLILLSILLPSVFIIYSRALEKAGVIHTEIAQRLSLVIAIIAAFVLFGDSATPLKLGGSVLGVIAVVLLPLSRQQDACSASVSGLRSISAHSGALLLLVWVGYGVIDITLKKIASLGISFSAALVISFLLACLGMLGLMLYRHICGHSSLTQHHLYVGLFLGALNFANISLYIKAHQSFSDQPAVVFASMNILVVTLGTLAGHFFYKEVLRPITLVALVMCFGAISLLTLSRWAT